MESQTRVEELRNRLSKAREAYYNLSPIISDQEYDALLDELRRISPEDFEVKTVGAAATGVWKKAVHEIPMGSLNKVNEIEEFQEWCGTTEKQELIGCYKFDGSSLELVYEGGKLIRCVTRGDGLVGEDITTNAIQIPNIPKVIPINGETVYVRGEVLMLIKTFEEKYSDKYANPRNTAAGKLRDNKSGGADCANLHFFAFNLVSKTAPNTEENRFRALEKMGFDVSDYIVGSMEDIIEWHKKVAENRSNLPFEIDGNVIRVNNISLQEGMGEHNMRPLGQIAWKFDPAMGITKVTDIKWQVGPTGRVTPVAVVEPVEIGGVTITNVSLHNIAMFNSLHLSQGCEVLVSRRNDVIPYIEKNLTESQEVS